MRPRLAALAAALTACCLPATSLAVIPSYTITDLGITLNSQSTVTLALNNRGQVAGTTFDAAGHDRAFLYSNGAVTLLPTLGGTENSAADINDSGQVVGSSDVIGNPYAPPHHAFLYTNGTMTDLGTFSTPPGTTNSYAAAINASGQIVGGGDFANGQYEHAFLSSNGKMTDLGTLPYANWSWANDINASGQIVGGEFGADGVSHAFLYSNGTITDLPTIPGWLSGSASTINATGQIIGGYHLHGGVYRGFLYQNGTMIDLGLPGWGRSGAYDINAAGQVVGCAYWLDIAAPARAFLYANGTITDLNTLVPPGNGWTLLGANAINDFGQIVGVGTNPAGQTHAFLLTPTPEPASLPLLSLATATLLTRRRLNLKIRRTFQYFS